MAKAMNYSNEISTKHHNFIEVADAATDAVAIDLSRVSDYELNNEDQTYVSEKYLGSSFEISCDKDTLFERAM